MLAPHFAGALIAREVPGEREPSCQADRTFDFAVTYDRTTVLMAAESLMSRVIPA